MKGQEEVHVHAPIVISDAGIFNTYERLLPKDVQAMPGEKEPMLILVFRKTILLGPLDVLHIVDCYYYYIKLKPLYTDVFL